MKKSPAFLTLGIETSCDETSAAVLQNAKPVLSCAVSSSVHLHRRFGGIIPEIASRFHLEYICAVTDTALKNAGVKLSAINLIAVTHTPGLVGSLLVGVSFAKGLSMGLGIPLIGVDHLDAHIFSPFLTAEECKFPFVGLVVSGGHTMLAYARDFDDIKPIGKTRDDAAGEAFDKTAKILNLGYPGGPVIDRLAHSVTRTPLSFSCAPLEQTFDFSFSGIKTSVLYKSKKLNLRDKKQKAYAARAFQDAVVRTITEKSMAACARFRARTLPVGGGVACNRALRERLMSAGAEANIRVLIAEPRFCQDNAAMIAMTGYFLHRKGHRSNYSLNSMASRRPRLKPGMRRLINQLKH